MSSPQEKFFSALKIAFHPNTKDADILAGIRGAARLLQDRPIADFLGFSPSPSSEKLIQQIMTLQERLTVADRKQRKAGNRAAELQQNLIATEGKLADATEFIKAQSIEICRLKTEAAKAVETAVREAARETAKAAPPPPKPSPQPPAANNNRLLQNEATWLIAVAVLSVCVAIIIGLTATNPPAAIVKQQAATVRSEEKPKPEPAPTGTMQPTPSGNYVNRSPEFPPASTARPPAR